MAESFQDAIQDAKHEECHPRLPRHNSGWPCLVDLFSSWLRTQAVVSTAGNEHRAVGKHTACVFFSSDSSMFQKVES